MSSVLRSAPFGVVYGRERRKDSRGNVVVQTDFSRPFEVRMLLQQVRSNRAEMQGQLTNDVRKVLFLPVDREGRRLADVGPWTQIVAPNGSTWDMAAPPELVGRRRGVKHWVAEVKSRPPSYLEGVVDRTG